MANCNHSNKPAAMRLVRGDGNDDPVYHTYHQKHKKIAPTVLQYRQGAQKNISVKIISLKGRFVK